MGVIKARMDTANTYLPLLIYTHAYIYLLVSSFLMRFHSSFAIYLYCIYRCVCIDAYIRVQTHASPSRIGLKLCFCHFMYEVFFRTFFHYPV